MEEKTSEVVNKKKWLENKLDELKGKKKRHDTTSTFKIKVEKKEDDNSAVEYIEKEMKESKYLNELASQFNWKAPSDESSYDSQLKKLDERIKQQETRTLVKEENKAVALGTSKINYMDPRITVAWCKRIEAPIEKVFNKSLLNKFPWAMESIPNWKF